MIRHLNKTQRLLETKLKKTRMAPWWASKGTRFNSLLYDSYRPAAQAAVALKRLERHFRLVLKFPFSLFRICCSSTSLKGSLIKQTSSNKRCLFRSFLVSSAAVCLVKHKRGVKIWSENLQLSKGLQVTWKQTCI